MLLRDNHSQCLIALGDAQYGLLLAVHLSQLDISQAKINKFLDKNSNEYILKEICFLLIAD